MKYVIPILVLVFLFSCSPNNTIDPQKIIDKSINAHGLENLIGNRLAFDFRDKKYSLYRTKEQYIYTRSFQDSLGFVEDVLINSVEFSRTVDGNQLELDEEWEGKYSNSVNSVLYFVQLPLTLNDPAAIKSYQGIKEIKGQNYHQVEIRFSREDGGKDFEDVFLYWFHTENNTMDYLAYSYITEGGGVRFRESINRRVIEGVTFQDYINYKPEDKNTPLVEMLGLFNEGKLIELSRIENKNIVIN